MKETPDLHGIDFEDGYIAVVDKPLRWTSADVVRKIKFTLRKLGYRRIKVGHAGTLDPLATGILLAAAVLGWILSANLIEIFLKNDPLVIEYGSMALRLQCITFPLVGWVTVSNMMLQTIGRTVKASLLAMSRQFLFFVPAVLLLPNFFGMLGVQLSQPIADIFSFILAVPLALSELQDMKRREEQLRIAPQADEM